MSKPADPVSELTLAALRSEIDAVDDAVLDLVRRRQMLARKINTLKSAAPDALKLRPDREAHVLRRLLDRAPDEDRRLVGALWREILSAGLAVQGEVTVAVWSASPGGLDQARLRFGVSARYVAAASPHDALALAEGGSTIAVLGLHPDAPWWTELPDQPNLWVFENLGKEAGVPAALAVGRVPPEALERGVTYRVCPAADPAGRVIARTRGWVLAAAVDADPAPPLDRGAGVIGCSPV